MGLQRVIGVSAALFLASAAMASPQETVTYTGVLSYGNLGDPSNVVETAAFTGTYTATKIRVSGTLTSLVGGTWPTDSRIEVTTPAGQVFDIIPIDQTGGFGTVSTPGELILDLPVPVVAAGTWTFLFFEDYDDSIGNPDASWDTITFTLDDAAATPPAVLTVDGDGVYHEVEDNDKKVRANIINSMTPGQVISGNTVGASTTVAGAGSADFYKITTSAAPLAIYRNQLTLSSPTPGQVPMIRGLLQTDGVINAGSDVTFQYGGGPDVAQWYGFGRQDQLYFAVTGNSATTSDYSAAFTRTVVTPIDAGTFIPGSITIERAPSQTEDMDFFVYDASFNPVPNYLNDGPLDMLTRDYTPGVYYLAWANWNTSNNQPAATDDEYQSENVLDFPNIIVNNSQTTFGDLSVQFTDSTGGPVVVPASKDNAFDIVWIKFTVAVPTGPTNPHGTGTAAPTTQQQTLGTLLTVHAFGGLNPPSTGMGVTGNLTSIGGSATQTFYDDGSHGDLTPGDNIFSYMATIGPATGLGTQSVPFTLTDGQQRSATGAINLTVTAAPTGGCCTQGNCSITSQYACTQGGGTYNGNGSNCGNVSYNITTSNATYSTISGTGTLLPNASNIDDGGDTVALPFSFQFFENSYDSVWICSNGFLTGGANSGTFFNTPLPDVDAPLNAIFPLWDDYNTSNGGNGQGDIYTSVDGVAPNRTFTVDWANVTQYIGAGGSFNSVNFQVVLHEGSNNIEFRYGQTDQCNAAGQCTGTGSDGDDRTVGVEDSTGSAAFSVGGATIGSGNTALMVTYVASAGPCAPRCGTADFNCDGDVGTDQDIAGFFACLSGVCPSAPCTNSADFNGDGDVGTDQDIDAFFRVLSGGHC